MITRTAIVVLALGACLVGGCGGNDEPKVLPGVRPEKRADAAAKRFLDRYATSEGRVQRIDQGGDTVGEGQAYGMLIAAASGDSGRFDAIWKWTKDNLRRKDGLISFLWKDGKVVDPQAASDADVDAARALLVGSCRFKRPELKQEALELGKAILRVETASVKGQPVLAAGPWAVKKPITLNPSYFSPATFAALGTASGDGKWGSLSATSRSVTDALLQGSSRLPPDWALLDGDKPVPTGSADHKGEPKFGFDAFRTLVRFAEDPDPAGRQIAARSWPVFEGQDPSSIPVEHDLTGKANGGTMSPVAQVAAAGAAHAAGKPGERDKLLKAAESLDKQNSTYYGAAWVAIGRYMLTTKRLRACG